MIYGTSTNLSEACQFHDFVAKQMTAQDKSSCCCDNNTMVKTPMPPCAATMPAPSVPGMSCPAQPTCPMPVSMPVQAGCGPCASSAGMTVEEKKAMYAAAAKKYMDLYKATGKDEYLVKSEKYSSYAM